MCYFADLLGLILLQELITFALGFQEVEKVCKFLKEEDSEILYLLLFIFHPR